MEKINYSEAYKSILNFVHLIESDEPSYTIIFEKEGNPFPIDAKFNVTTNGDFALSFSSDSLISPIAFNAPLMEIHSEWYNIVFDSVDIRERRATYNNSIEKPDIYHIITKSFRSAIDNDWNDSYFCAFYKYDHSFFSPNKSCVLNNNTQPIGHNPVEINIGECELTIFWGEKADGKEMDERYLTLFSKTKTDFTTFKKVVDTIRVVWGLITGYYIGKSVYYVSCVPERGWDGLSFMYNNLQEELVTYRGLLDTTLYDKISEEDLCLSIKEFEKLANLLYNNDSFFRAGQLLIQASHDEGLSKGGIAAVALEAITGEVEKIRKSKENDRNELKLPKTLFSELQGCICRFRGEDKITDSQCDHYLKKLNTFSTPFNSDKLIMPFEYLNITLNLSERDVINNRNSILHGNMPQAVRESTFMSKLDKKDLIFYVSNKLIMLCGMLLFGMANVDKLIIDWGVTIIVMKHLIADGRNIDGYGKKHRRILDSKPEDDSLDWLL